MRQALLALMVIGLAMSLAWAGSMAYFSDTETSSGNTLQAGTLDLKIKDGDMDWSDGIGAEWIMSNMMPGDTEYGSVDFRHLGTIQADHLEITCDYTIEDPSGPESDTQEDTPADYMAGNILITIMDYAGYFGTENCLELLGDANSNDLKDLYDLKALGIDSLLPPKIEGLDTRLDMTIQFNPEAGNDFQGDTLTVTMIFTLNQDPSQ